MELLLIYAVLTSALFYLGSRAVITRWLWSRYPRWLASFMDCAACSGFWYGAGLAILFRNDLQAFGYTGPIVSEWYSPIFVGLCSVVMTPIVAGIMQAGFERLGSAIEDE